MQGGRAGARDALARVWERMGATSDERLDVWFRGLAPAHVARAIEFSPAFLVADGLTRVSSPYALGPFYTNPLKSVVDELDFDSVCAEEGPELFLCATRVRTGKIRIFQGAEITSDAILASACLPTIFQAVEIDDPETGRVEAYWDGGYTGNPALFPLFYGDLPGDVLVVNINPLERDAVPVTPQEIQNRINEISFNSSLFREMRAINFVNRLQAEGTLPPGRMKTVRMHMVADDALMTELSVATKLVPNPFVMQRLKEAGRNAAHDFLRYHKDDIGERSTVDLEQMFG